MSDDNVSQVIKLWGFEKNYGRPGVRPMHSKDDFVYSEVTSTPSQDLGAYFSQGSSSFGPNHKDTHIEKKETR